MRAGLARLSDNKMGKDEFDNEDFEKIFNEIIQSDDLQEVSKDFENEVNLGIKELILLQQSLGDAISHISEILSSMTEMSMPKNPMTKSALIYWVLYTKFLRILMNVW